MYFFLLLLGPGCSTAFPNDNSDWPGTSLTFFLGGMVEETLKISRNVDTVAHRYHKAMGLLAHVRDRRWVIFEIFAGMVHGAGVDRTLVCVGLRTLQVKAG